MSQRYIIGIDEVGRGALAGPVVVAASRIEVGKFLDKNAPFQSLKDSKRLSARQREKWLQYFEANSHIAFAVARVYPRQIEKRNISRSANIAAFRAYEKIIKNLGSTRNVKAIFLDGGLFLKSRASQKVIAKAVTFPKADETVPAVAAASIVAKVHRDRFMVKMAKRYPEYGFAIHKGYGTKMHLAALKKHGPSDIHRSTFSTGLV